MNKIFYPAQLKYISSFRKESSELLKEMEEFAKEQKIPILSWQAAELIEQLILMNDPKRCLEIGTAIAYTAIRIAKNLKKKSVLHTIELSEDNIALANGFIERAELGGRIKLIEGDASAFGGPLHGTALVVGPDVGRLLGAALVDDYQGVGHHPVIVATEKNLALLLDLKGGAGLGKLGKAQCYQYAAHQGESEKPH